MLKEIHVHELKFEEKDNFSKQFNICSDLFGRYFNMNNTDEEANKIFEQYLVERWRLETGSY